MRRGERELLFPCECVSARSGYSDPWAGVTQNNLLKNGTKERVLNSLAREPKTIALLAAELRLSQPTVHAHINDMLQSGLLREAVGWQKTHPAEHFYEPAFPVVRTADQRALAPACDALAVHIAEIFENALPALERALNETTLPQEGWCFADVSQYLYCALQRGARRMLEQRGVLPERKKHADGVEWLFWAEESSGK